MKERLVILWFAIVLALTPIAVSAHTSETRVINGRCQIHYAAIFTIWSGDHGHFWGPWYFFACHW